MPNPPDPHAPMTTLRVKVPAAMDEDLEAYLAEHPHYLSKSELVRDALRRLLADGPAPSRTRSGRDRDVGHRKEDIGDHGSPSRAVETAMEGLLDAAG